MCHLRNKQFSIHTNASLRCNSVAIGQHIMKIAKLDKHSPHDERKYWGEAFMAEQQVESFWEEAERVAALESYAILDTPPEQEFDDLVRLAANILNTKVAAVNFIAADRQWFKAEIGLGLRETPLGDSICARAALLYGDLMIPDLLADSRFCNNPLVSSEPKLRFYAGEILKSSDGLPLGTLCVLDPEPRPEGITEQQRFALKALARQVMGQLELRRVMAEQKKAGELTRRTLLSVTDLAIISTDLRGKVLGWNPGATKLTGWTEAEILGLSADLFFTRDDREIGALEAALERVSETGRLLNERWHQKKDGSLFWGSGEIMQLRNQEGQHVGYVKIIRDRTEQHLAGESMAALNERYGLAARATNDAVWDWDFHTDIIQWNEALHETYGWALPPSELTGHWWRKSIHPDDQERVERNIQAIINGADASWDDEYRFLKADGSYAHVLNRGYLVRDKSGRAIRMIGALLDMTARERAEAALSESRSTADRERRLYEAILNNTPDLAYVWGLDHRFIYANDTLLRLWGKTWNEAIGLNCWELGYPDWHSALHDREIDHIIQTREPVRGQVPYEGTVGLRIYDYILVPVISENGEVEAVAGTTRDVTEAHEIQAALKLHVERMQIALEAGAIIGTWHWDLVTNDVSVDESFAKAFGLSPNLGLAGLNVEQVLRGVHPDDKDALVEALDAAVLKGGFYTHQYRVKRDDGEYYWVEANGRVEHAADGSPLQFPGVLIDLQARRSIEAERDNAEADLRALNETLEQQVAERTAALMRTEEHLRQSQKMEAVGQLTGGLAHDFNNLLTGVSGNLELLSTRIAQGRLKNADYYVNAAQGAAKRAASLTHRLLAFSRRQTLAPKAADVNMLVADMADLVRRTVGPEIVLEVVEAADLWMTLVDVSQLENAILNLCINARDAMPDGGRITIETSNKWIDPVAAQAQQLQPGQYVALSVTDNGVGIAPDIIEKVFDPFFTTKPMGQGTGLGLSMIYGFVRQSGGQIRVYSELGRGTTICLYLPRCFGELSAPESPPDLSEAPRAAAGDTVLIVDDEPTIRMLISEVLNELGYSALEAADGASGLALLQSDARIDLLVTDVGLPGGMNGRQMAEAARVERPKLKVLFITGYAENAVISNGYLEAGMHVMTKPFTLENLASKIKSLLST